MIKEYIKLFLLALIITSCGNEKPESHDAMGEHDDNRFSNYTVTPKKYTCPMHPEIVSDTPGICPKCKMDLVEMKGSETLQENAELDILLKPTNQFVISQVKTVLPQNSTIPITIEATGKVYYDTREISIVSSKLAGRIQKLYVKYLYQPVKKGQKLMDIYSKELLTEQENYIYLLQNDPDNLSLIKTAEDRLRLQGLTAEQIKKIKSENKTIEFISIYSPVSGHLHDLTYGNTSQDIYGMGVPEQRELVIKEGMYVQKGQGVFNIYNTDKMWVILNIHSNKLELVKKGQKVKLSINGEELTGADYKIDFIEPEIKTNQNTLSARVYISNLNNAIKVGSNVKAIISGGNRTGYFIPSTSIVHLGNSTVVFVKEKALFKAKKVVTGIEMEGRVELLSGITKNDSIAENAQLLIDSESFIKSEN
jgi:membrane fusion protein, copper/silver efflux system